MSEEPKKIISLAELAKHNKQDDMWVIINGRVYNVSKFIDEHPGGEEVLADVAGKDCTREFEDVGHSEDAVEILERLYIGDGDPSEVTIKAAKLSVSEDFSSRESSSSSSLLYLILAVLVAAGGIFYLQAFK